MTVDPVELGRLEAIRIELGRSEASLRRRIRAADERADELRRLEAKVEELLRQVPLDVARMLDVAIHDATVDRLARLVADRLRRPAP